MNKDIRDVELMARAVLKDEELMKTIENIRMEEIDRKIQLSTAYQEGKKEIAKKLKEDGVSIDKIIQLQIDFVK